MGQKYTCSCPSMLKGPGINKMEEVVLFAHDPSTTDAELIQHIIESKYAPADLKEIVDQCKHLNQGEQKLLLKLLQKFDDLLDGTLGTWNTEPIQFELKDPNQTPCHAKLYPIPYSQE